MSDATTIDEAHPPRASRRTCPQCRDPMAHLELPARDGSLVELEMCRPCRSIWFDSLEAVKLSGLGWTLLLRQLASLPPARPLLDRTGPAQCLRCDTPLTPLRNRNRYGSFTASQCPSCQGQLQSHSMLLASRGLFRPLLAWERSALADERRTPDCLNCGASVADADDRCSYCDSPLQVIDMPRLAAALQERLARFEAGSRQTLMAWPCRGCGQALDPVHEGSCRSCKHPVVVPSLLDLTPLFDAVDAALLAIRSGPPGKAPVLTIDLPDTGPEPSVRGMAWTGSQAMLLRFCLGAIPGVLLWLLYLTWYGEPGAREDSWSCRFGGCETPYPANWPALAEAQGALCPLLAGRFQVTGDLPLAALFGRPVQTAALQLTPEIGGGLRVALDGSTAAVPDPVALRPPASFRCADGWLSFDTPAGAGGTPGTSHSVAFRPTEAGQLAVRLDRLQAQGWSHAFRPRIQREWLLWTPHDSDASGEDDAELLSDDSPQGDAARALRLALPPGTRLESVKPTDDHDTVLRFVTLQPVPMARFQPALEAATGGQGRVLSVQKQPGVAQVLLVKLGLPTATPESLAQAERERIQARVEAAARRDSHVPQFLKLLPPGGQMSAFTGTEDALEAEVRLPRDSSVHVFAQVIDRSEHFTGATVLSAQDNAYGGLTGRIAFRVR